MVPIRELPYGPAAIIAASEAGQMTASDYAPNTPNTACVTRGVHRWLADVGSALKDLAICGSDKLIAVRRIKRKEDYAKEGHARE